MKLLERGTIETNGVTFRAIRIFGVTMFQDPSYECLGVLRGWIKVRNWSGVKWISLCALLLCGCVSRTVTYQGVAYTHKSLLTQQSFGELEFNTSSNAASVKVKNFANDQVSALREAKELLVEANKLKTPAP